MIPTPALPPGAACLGSDADFFPARAAGTANHGVDAKRCCAQCPAVEACLVGSFERGEEFDFGIWGGAGGDLRRFLGRTWRARTARPAAWDHALAQHLEGLAALAAGTRPPVMNRNGDGATHGLRVTYNRGCRCDPCEWAMKDNVAQITAARRPPVDDTVWATNVVGLHADRPLALPVEVVHGTADGAAAGCTCRPCRFAGADHGSVAA